MKNNQKLEEPAQIVTRIIDEETARFAYKGDVKVSETEGFEGRIDMLTTSKIHVGYPPAYVEENGIEHIVSAPFEKATRALVRHELNHKGGGEQQGCPRTMDFHLESVLEPISDTLSTKGLPNVPIGQGHTLYTYFANLMEDIVDNAEQSSIDDPIGTFLLYHHDATRNNKPFPPLFDAFVTVQERLVGCKRATKLLSPYHTSNKAVTNAVNAVLTQTGIDKMTRTVHTKRKNIAHNILDRDKAKQYLLNEQNWPEISRIIAEEFAPLVDVSQLSKPHYIEQTFLPLKGEGDGFVQETQNPETMMKEVYKKYKQADPAQPSTPGNKKGRGKKGGMGQFNPPTYLDKNNALDLLYQRLARNMEIKTRASTTSVSYPAVRYGWKDFDPNTENALRAKIAYRGGLVLKTRKFVEEEPAEYYERKGNIPSIRFILRDDSCSTQEEVPESDGKGIIMNPWAEHNLQWTDRSIYHHELLAEYGLREYLRRQGVLKHANYKSASYSSTTLPAMNLAESTRIALNPTFQGTQFDMEKLNKLFGKDELVISLSDGEIQNWASDAGNGITVCEAFIAKAKRNQFVHIHIGEPTQMSHDLQRAGLPVIYDTGKNVGKIVIDLTRSYVTNSRSTRS